MWKFVDRLPDLADDGNAHAGAIGFNSADQLGVVHSGWKVNPEAVRGF